MKDLLPNKQQFRAEEVSEIFGVTTRTVYRWIDEGRLVAQRTPGGHHYRILRQDVLKFMQEN